MMNNPMLRLCTGARIVSRVSCCQPSICPFLHPAPTKYLHIRRPQKVSSPRLHPCLPNPFSGESAQEHTVFGQRNHGFTAGTIAKTRSTHIPSQGEPMSHKSHTLEFKASDGQPAGCPSLPLRMLDSHAVRTHTWAKRPPVCRYVSMGQNIVCVLYLFISMPLFYRS